VGGELAGLEFVEYSDFDEGELDRASDGDFDELGFFSFDDIKKAGEAVVDFGRSAFGGKGKSKAKKQAQQQRARAEKLDRELEIERIRAAERRKQDALRRRNERLQRERAEMERLETQRAAVRRRRAEVRNKKSDKGWLYGLAASAVGLVAAVALRPPPPPPPPPPRRRGESAR